MRRLPVALRQRNDVELMTVLNAATRSGSMGGTGAVEMEFHR